MDVVGRQRAALQQADIAVAAAQAHRQRSGVDTFQHSRKVTLPVQRLQLRAVLRIAAPGLKVRFVA
jgi:hypothetical protein